MRSKAYYLLFVLYILMVGFILFLNGVFTNEVTSFSNLAINLIFLIIIGILFIISAFGFARLNRLVEAMEEVKERILTQHAKKKGCLWPDYQEEGNVFDNEILDPMFDKYRERIKSYRTKKGLSNTCDLDEYINEELLDQAGLSYINSGISGTLTGLGILGTFIGLSLGLGSFSGDDIFTISDNVGPLLEGMKVAFHTSVYGIFFSLIFNFIYRGIMADAYEKLSDFLGVFRGHVMPTPMNVDENTGAMLIYQANMASSLKSITELLKGSAKEQTEGMERIVHHFLDKLSQTMGTDFEKLGNTLKGTCEVQREYGENSRQLEKATKALLEASRSTQETLERMLREQEGFQRELTEQKEKLMDTCDSVTEEISNHLYTFRQVEDINEK